MSSAITKSILSLPAPVAGKVDLLIIAGEHSGDEHAARMLSGALAQRPGLRVAALGGPRLRAAGAQLLRDMTATSVIGFVETLKSISYFKALFSEILRWIGEHQPRAVCFVDSSGLNLRIAQQMFDRGLSAKAGGKIKTVYYISPQIWASRAGRRFKMAKYLDGLAVIFPFEPEVYADTKLPVEFVGHPFMAEHVVSPVRYDLDGPVLLLPGSRRSAVERIFPVMLAAYEKVSERDAVAIYPSQDILAVLRAANPPSRVELRPAGEPVAASAVLTSSGTMSMRCALAGIPGVVMYRAHPLEYVLGRMLVKVPYLGIANLLIKEPMYPEYIQGAAKPEVLANELKACLSNPSRRVETAARAEKLRAILHQPAKGSAADWLVRQLG
ncbi:MAG: lipid-A-disaccharide synthase [Verrucomicrobia bacterium]|nr:lipid-A-disaccharide synthase [Verrucomicrobiota bacterium]